MPLGAAAEQKAATGGGCVWRRWGGVAGSARANRLGLAEGGGCQRLLLSPSTSSKSFITGWHRLRPQQPFAWRYELEMASGLLYYGAGACRSCALTPFVMEPISAWEGIMAFPLGCEIAMCIN